MSIARGSTVGDLRHLREEGLVETVRLPGHPDDAVVLTKDGRDLLERHRLTAGRIATHQAFYSGVGRERELEHDIQVYGAYLRPGRGATARPRRPHRFRLLDDELKREYLALAARA